MTRTSLAALLLPTMMIACGGDDAPESPEPPGPTSAPAADREPGVTVEGDTTYFTTGDYELGPGEERFLCYAAEVPEGVAIGGYRHEGHPTLHHVVFSEATAPEPEGYSECDVLFRFTWEPMYIAGAGSSQIDFPDDMGHHLEAGDQLVAQLHLLNASAETVTDSVTIEMNHAPVDDPRPIGSYVFGSLNVALPPLSRSTVEGSCEVTEPVELIAGFPHMHLLGEALTFQAGPSETELEVLFERDPYDFDDQGLVPLDIALSAGDHARVECAFDNPYDETITFGESTMNEMCFFIGFSPDRSGINACSLGGPAGDPVPIDPAAGVCGEHEPTPEGVGAPCTAGGNECPADFGCTADTRGLEQGVCFKNGCSSSDECGGGFNTCCAAVGGGAFNICIPEACRLETCTPL